MNKYSSFQKYLDIFNNYVSKFDNNDELINYKINHSYRVADLCFEIAKSLDLTKKEIEIAYICGLFHDIGRFEQVKETSSLDDSVFVDHGDLGYKILKEKLIQSITNIDYIHDIVLESTKNHNKLKIGKVQCNQLLYCKIVRDADKIDILNNWQVNIKGIYPLNEKILSCIYSKKLCTEAVYNELDHLLFVLCYLYDINFKYSFYYLKRNKGVDKKLTLIKKHCSENVGKIVGFIKEYIDNQVNCENELII